jgi:hypothetical protein
VKTKERATTRGQLESELSDSERRIRELRVLEQSAVRRGDFPETWTIRAQRRIEEQRYDLILWQIMGGPAWAS